MSKRPAEWKLIVTREIGEDDEWKLDSLLRVIETEIRARERSLSTGSRIPVQEHPAGVTLLTSWAATPACCFCKQNHLSRDCTSVVDVEARKQSLRRNGRRYICLRRNHIARKCRSSIKCTECEGQHHVAVCPVPTRSTPKPPVATPQNPPSGLNPEDPTNVPEGKSVTGMLCTHPSNHILLQMAIAEAFNPY